LRRGAANPPSFQRMASYRAGSPQEVRCDYARPPLGEPSPPNRADGRLHYTWESGAIEAALAALRHRQGRLLGRMESLGFERLRSEASLQILTSDVVKSSAIEGEILNPTEVRSSIARRLGLDVGGLSKSGRDVEGIVELMLDATQRFDQPLSAERMWSWHAALFPTGRSGLRRIAVGIMATKGSWRNAGGLRSYRSGASSL
jgi:Fic family protein